MLSSLFHNSKRNHRIKQVIEELNFPFEDFTIEAFVAHIEKYLKRNILLIPMAMPAGCYGAWVSDQDLPVEYVLFKRGLSPLHEIHIQLHELGHMILGHKTLKLGSRELGLLVENNDKPQMVGALYRSQTRSSLEDDEAEEFAIVVQLLWAAHYHPESSEDSSSPDGQEYLKLFLVAD